MSIDISRSIHPDLLDEYQEQLAAGEAPTAPRRGRRGRAAASSQESLPPESGPPADASAEGSAERDTSAEPPSLEWVDQVRNATDPKEMLSLLTRNMAKEDLGRDDVLAGMIGDLGNQRARKLIEDNQRAQEDRVRQDAFSKGDLYTLGQLQAQQLELERSQRQAQQEYETNPYMMGVRQFQSSLPEQVQRAVQGRQYPDFPSYLRAVQEAAISHGVESEISKRTEGLRLAALSQTVGREQSPELDGGPAQSYREITDAQVAAMDLEEYGRYFDEKGRPKPGVRVRLERGIDLRQR